MKINKDQPHFHFAIYIGMEVLYRYLDEELKNKIDIFGSKKHKGIYYLYDSNPNRKWEVAEYAEEDLDEEYIIPITK